MTMADITNGPTQFGWLIVVLFAVLSGVFLSGRGSWLIAGFNTASREKKERYDEKKLCRVTGGGLAVITVVIAFTLLFEDRLPASFANVLGIIIMMVVAGIIYLENKICKKK